MEILFKAFLASLLCLPAVTLAGQRWRNMRAIASGFFVITLMAGVTVAAFSFWRGDAISLDLSAVAPFPFSVALDRLSAFFLLLICTVAAPVIIFSVPYVDAHYQGLRRAWFW